MSYAAAAAPKPGQKQTVEEVCKLRSIIINLATAIPYNVDVEACAKSWFCITGNVLIV